MRILAGLEKFSLQLEADGRSLHTVRQYRRHVRLLARWLRQAGHGGEVEAVGPEDVARFLASPAARRKPGGGAKKATSLNALRSSVKGFFGYLHRAGYVAHDPSRLLRRAVCAGGPPRHLSEDERERLLSTLAAATQPQAERDHALFHLMLATGLRLGAALGLDTDDVHLEQGEIRVRRAKGGREERAYLGEGIRQHLGRFLGDLTSGPLFRTANGRRLAPRQAQRRFRAWLKRAGIERPFSPHSLRHSFAMRLYRRTGDILLVKEALRHRSIASTLVYARVDQDRLREAVAGA